MTFSMTITSSLSSRHSVRPPPYMCTVEAKRIVGWALQGVTDQSSFTLLQRLFRINRLTLDSPLRTLLWCVPMPSSYLGFCFQNQDFFLALYHENVHLFPLILSSHISSSVHVVFRSA
jgi:hypothetical protein